MYVHILLPTTITKKTLFDGLCIGVFTLKDVIFYKPQLPLPRFGRRLFCGLRIYYNLQDNKRRLCVYCEKIFQNVGIDFTYKAEGPVISLAPRP